MTATQHCDLCGTMGDSKHDDSCRCQGCCREKFKTIDPALVGKAPQLRRSCRWPVPPEE